MQNEEKSKIGTPLACKTRKIFEKINFLAFWILLDHKERQFLV
jgi:hypothetical protein